MSPDRSDHSYELTVEASVPLTPDVVYHAWTQAFDRWFAVEDSIVMSGEPGSTWFFETEMDGRRHPHYGRFLRLEPDALVETTWMTGNPARWAPRRWSPWRLQPMAKARNSS